jgi:gamma-glutamylcyclotransferase (GGCT)/AIG2-like uncharacterized protein YtfP
VRFFFYGTLMDAGVRLAVLGAAARRLDFQPAILDGWRRAIVRGRSYPVVLPAAGRSVCGLLADRVGGIALARLDRFEGAEYRRTRVTVRCTDGGRASCWVYAASDASVAGAGSWDFDRWRGSDRAVLLRRLASGRR